MAVPEGGVAAVPVHRHDGGGEMSTAIAMIELETGREHGPFDSEADVALCLAFEKLDRDRVEVVCDANPLSRIAGWE